jgi:transposase
MRQQTRPSKEPAEKVVQDIRRATRMHYSAEEKIRIVLEGLRGEDSIAELCRREGIAQNLYYRWSKDFLEAGKKRLAGDTARAATTDEVHDLRREARALKQVVADLTLENRLLKKKRWHEPGHRAQSGRIDRRLKDQPVAVTVLPVDLRRACPRPFSCRAWRNVLGPVGRSRRRRTNRDVVCPTMSANDGSQFGPSGRSDA